MEFCIHGTVLFGGLGSIQKSYRPHRIYLSLLLYRASQNPTTDFAHRPSLKVVGMT